MNLPASIPVRTFISGCHILHRHHVLDAYGHLSVRNPERSDTFFMSRDLAPGLISSSVDLVEYFVHDASPVNPASPAGYIERFIHSEIYQKYPEVQSVVHSHASTVLPYTITGVNLRPCVHMSGFLGASVPNFDVAKFYKEDDKCDLLIRNKDLGAHLAECFSAPESDSESTRSVVLMRGHGFTAVGGSIPESVYRAIYTVENAKIQTVSMTLSAAAAKGDGPHSGIYFLPEHEIRGTKELTQRSVMRSWKLWVREVETGGLYTNLA
ncbi:conserved hypothetical protein [Talaromyces stipitatus ATCC 10500]|uniref:Decarboxylase tropJ n=1 Tax=Talaromyces stipitatus (strain ATCC 10500 / CBS 375.48 / QM 6759 / NRRL 1006) TaxID=441959 RepID=TROPJ_TALSN|nr:uncharacterized protein TSTA_117720 [Talaromyces stipitatus ATCC 10500]B8M9J5.1 RecName: Full=Decarboxylase tropJ; AltName: Full=Tropolone synthesis protein J [Talaromyces stipitatus ATCC 10500]EED17997.1 conserved hypothetical protein [Talaromyces stipitatus ATCC 10500]DAA64702.1 TPA_exp: TropJ [Talaromyces stipitatus ATCC 10500]